jgi:thioredoxin 1
MQEISVSELKKKIQDKETMLVSFSASWCGPCKMLKEELKKVNSNTPIYKIDVEEDIDFSIQYSVRSVPTMKMFKEGSVVSTTVGLRSAPEINKLITENIR